MPSPHLKSANNTKRLLLIDDDTHTRQGLAELLSQHGYWVAAVRNGCDAFEAIANTSIDLVLCDYSLPDRDGLQLCRELKQLRPELGLCLMTAYNKAEIIASAQAFGIVKIFHKPLDLEKFLASLATLFRATDENMLCQAAE